MSALPARPVFAEAAQMMASARARPRERRRFRRAPIQIGGRMMDPAGRELDCRTADISPGDVRIFTPADIEVGASVVLYLDGLGRVAGRVVRRCGEQEYAIVFDVSPHKREKLAETLIVMMNADRLAAEDQPGPIRTRRHHARIELEDGEVIDGVVIDFSLAGLTVKTAQRPPPLGAWVRIGGVHGRVARYTEGGFGVDLETRAAPSAG
jgi:hypothetical protein